MSRPKVEVVSSERHGYVAVVTLEDGMAIESHEPDFLRELAGAFEDAATDLEGAFDYQPDEPRYYLPRGVWSA